jgi:hypothetical protein
MTQRSITTETSSTATSRARRIRLHTCEPMSVAAVALLIMRAPHSLFRDRSGDFDYSMSVSSIAPRHITRSGRIFGYDTSPDDIRLNSSLGRESGMADCPSLSTGAQVRVRSEHYQYGDVDI